MMKRRTFTVMAFVLGLSLAACGGSAPTPAASPTTAVNATQAPLPTSAPAVAATEAPTAPPVATAAPSAPAGDAKDAILAALRKQLTSGPYRTSAAITSENGSVEVIGEVIPPDRMRSVSTIAGRKSEMIFIGDKGWMKSGDADWKDMGASNATMALSQFSTAMVDDMANAISDARLIGPDVVNNAPAMAYSYFMDSNKFKTPIDVKSNVQVWIDVATGLIVKQEIDGEVMGVKSKTVQTVTYDPAIKIEAPAQ